MSWRYLSWAFSSCMLSFFFWTPLRLFEFSWPCKPNKLLIWVSRSLDSCNSFSPSFYLSKLDLFIFCKISGVGLIVHHLHHEQLVACSCGWKYKRFSDLLLLFFHIISFFYLCKGRRNICSSSYFLANFVWLNCDIWWVFVKNSRKSDITIARMFAYVVHSRTSVFSA